MEGIQYRGGVSSVRWKIFSTEEAHHQYGGGLQYGPATSSVRSRVCSTGLPKLLRVVGDCMYLGKMIFYKQSYYNIDFVPLRLSPDVAETHLGCYDMITFGSLDNSSVILYKGSHEDPGKIPASILS